tara:strand:- start:6461 stop:6850 length:390 start_codon:yes stop_codon:yes gene_type:complete
VNPGIGSAWDTSDPATIFFHLLAEGINIISFVRYEIHSLAMGVEIVLPFRHQFCYGAFVSGLAEEKQGDISIAHRLKVEFSDIIESSISDFLHTETLRMILDGLIQIMDGDGIIFQTQHLGFSCSYFAS